MAEEIPFNRDAPTAAGVVEQVSPLLRRIICNNPSPFTFTGTCTYIVGHGSVAIIDPGPETRPEHLEVILNAVRGESVEAILVTHTHRDHSPLTRPLQAITGAKVYGEGPHRPARPLADGEVNEMDASGDKDFLPDLVLNDGDVVSGKGWTLEALTTPGHCANHLAFSLHEENGLISGDHVMAWSTSIVAPPDGAMGDYMASLEKLRKRNEEVFWPGHGGPVKEPARFMRALGHHRNQREASIMRRLQAGDEVISDMVRVIYEGIDPRLHNAASLNVLAHLEDLIGRGIVRSEGPLSVKSRFILA